MDIQYLLILQNFRETINGFLNTFLTFISAIAVDYYLALPALILFWAVDKKKGMRVLGTWGTSLLGNAILKSTFCVYRPWIRSDQIQPLSEAVPGATGYSFPSGHSTSSAGFYFGLARAYRKYKGLLVFCIIMVLLTMFSRNYVGVHTPQDVFIGALTGLVMTFVVSAVADWVDRHPDKDWVVLVVAIVICAAALCYIALKSYPMDYVNGELLVDPKKMTVDGFKDPGKFMGIVIGWFIERRFIKFSVEGTPIQKVMRCLVGGLLFVFYWTAISVFVGNAAGNGIVHFIMQASTMILFMTVYPLIFSKIEQRSRRK